MCRIWRPPRNSIFVRSKLLLQVISLWLIFTLRIDVYALRDLMGHCYVHFAFLFTLNIFTLVALMHSSGNLFQSFTTLWENVYFLISNLEWLFTKARLCPLVMLSFFILKNISLFNPSYPCIILKTSIWSPRIRLVSRVVNLHCWRPCLMHTNLLDH